MISYLLSLLAGIIGWTIFLFGVAFVWHFARCVVEDWYKNGGWKHDKSRRRR